MRRAIFRGFVLSVACVLLAPVGSAQAAEAPTGPKTYNVWQWNVAGDGIHEGLAVHPDPEAVTMVEQAVGSIVSRGVDLAAFNELCENQYSEIVRQLRDRKWPVAENISFARFEPSRPAGNNAICAGNAIGNALFSKKKLGPADRIKLPEPVGSPSARSLLCAPLDDGSDTVFCTTHITTDTNYKTLQLQAVFKQLVGYGTPIIAGDFNVQPHHAKLDAYYSPKVAPDFNDGNTGVYRELDDADRNHCVGHGEPTTDGVEGYNPCGTNSKVDLIFVDENNLTEPASYSADSLAISTACTGVAACSDHRILTGTVTVK
ncbi:endonuclease/exonuclease/phosphatase family protein [Streptomyces sp. NPDC056773]|uniref:endonuclease/exonuclease/phosphatase family protein n=1 Tax=unclassified Streptomyces TaxID=2593676 RepID=UPI00369694F1